MKTKSLKRRSKVDIWRIILGNPPCFGKWNCLMTNNEKQFEMCSKRVRRACEKAKKATL
jgi:hypothetical protein